MLKFDVENVLKILDKKTSAQMAKEAIKEVCPNKDSIKQNKFIIVLAVLISFLIAFKKNTVSNVKNTAETFNTVNLIIFGVLFTGFTFFEAIVNDDMLKQLVSKEKEGKTYLQIHYEYFIHVIFLNFYILVLNILLIIVLGTIGDNFIVFGNMFLNESISFVLITVYIYINLVIIMETKSYIFNLYNIYTVSKIDRLTNIIKNEEKIIKK